MYVVESALCEDLGLDGMCALGHAKLMYLRRYLAGEKPRWRPSYGVKTAPVDIQAIDKKANSNRIVWSAIMKLDKCLQLVFAIPGRVAGAVEGCRRVDVNKPTAHGPRIQNASIDDGPLERRAESTRRLCLSLECLT